MHLFDHAGRGALERPRNGGCEDGHAVRWSDGGTGRMVWPARWPRSPDVANGATVSVRPPSTPRFLGRVGFLVCPSRWSCRPSLFFPPNCQFRLPRADTGRTASWPGTSSAPTSPLRGTPNPPSPKRGRTVPARPRPGRLAQVPAPRADGSWRALTSVLPWPETRKTRAGALDALLPSQLLPMPVTAASSGGWQ